MTVDSSLPSLSLFPDQLDRVLGVVIAGAAGDALGAGYETRRGWEGEPEPAMIGGGLGNFAPGEWTDDTTMAWCILEPASRGLDLRGPEGLDAVAGHYHDWSAGNPPDIGIQTGALLGRFRQAPTGAELMDASRALHERTGRTAGNGSLMRTGVVTLPHLADEAALVEAAGVMAQLTHFDALNVEACVLWCCAIRHAVLVGEMDVRVGLRWLEAPRRAFWGRSITDAEVRHPRDFEQGNGFVVIALQAAWSAIVHTPVGDDEPQRHLRDALARAVRIGNATDTVACIAGQLLGARWGASAVPDGWRRLLHGYPGITGEQLVELGRRVVTG